MRQYWAFLKSYFPTLSFGWLLTFFSSFGQTFLISLFVPFLLRDLAISKGSFGALYAVATVLASFILLRFGHLIDERPVRPFTRKTVFLLSGASLLLAFVFHPAVLLLVLIGLRLAGQGLMSHISISVMSRYFSADRGKALSISTLGYSVGEMVFPSLIGLVIAGIGWRYGAATGGLLVLGILPVLARLPLESLDEKPAEASTVKKRNFLWGMMKEQRFWIMALPVFVQSFVVTGFFFYQFVMVETKGWPNATYTALFAGYGAIRLIFSLYGGLLVDRLSALKVFPLYLLPLLAGVASLFLLTGMGAAAAFLFLVGISVGLSGIVSSALIAELYGTANIGQVRSLFTVVMVISTALAPLLFGLALDYGYSFEWIAQLTAAIIFATALHNLRIFGLQTKA